VELVPNPALFFVLAGLIGGVVLFARGLLAYKRDRLISSIATSSLDGIAAGEVRVSGVVEAIDSTLMSPLQSKPCVWYRSKVEEVGDNGRVLLDEERATEFRVTNDTGAIRVVPRGARWEIHPVFEEADSITGDEPIGLKRRGGSSFAAIVEEDPAEMSDAEREAAVQALLTVQQPVGATVDAGWSVADGNWGTGVGLARSRGRHYREARLEPGETVTIIGQALPWADIRDALHAFDPSSNVELAIAEDVAAARAAGTLAASPEEAWGNAAIPGFGIGQPTMDPELHPDADPIEASRSVAHGEALTRYQIPGEELILSRGQHGEMAVYMGAPQAATMHHDFAFALGVMGAFMAVFSTLALGAILTGNL